MATMQMTRTPLQQKSWEGIFPNEQVTEQKSLLFVKKLLAVAISSVTYLRAIFPEHAFGDKCLEDLNLKVLRDESSCPGACQVIKWVKGCFDALEKKYLKTLVLGVFTDPNDPETLLESFTFKFSYKNHGEIDIYRNDQKLASAYSSEETKKATIMLLRTLVILTNTLKPLPENAMMTMKLFYFDEVTPSDYEPPGFKTSTNNNFQFVEDVTNIAIGEVTTPFHTLKLRVKTGTDQFQTDGALNDVVDVVAVEEPTSSIYMPMEEMTTKNVGDCHPVVASVVNEKKINVKTKEPKSERCEEDKMEEDEFPVRCPCGCNEDDGLMIMCSGCSKWQHGICFLITGEAKAPAVHICELCSQLDNYDQEPTDPYLKDMNPIATQATCLWRRTLMACLEFKRVLAPQLARRLGVETTVAQGLLNRLEKEGFVSSTNKGKKLGKMVDREKIKTDGIPCYLNTPKTLKKKAGNETSSDSHKEKEDIACDYTENDSGISSRNNSVNKVKKNANVKTEVDSLVAKTNKINLEGRKGTRSSSGLVMTKSQDSDFVPHSGRRGRKRAHSRMDNNEFELSASQDNESESKRKKASIAQKHLVI